MSLTVIGVSHRTAPVEVRERLAFTPSEVEPALESLRIRTGVEETVVVSTCNRTEIYLHPVLSETPVTEVHHFLQAKGGPLPGPITDFLYRHTGEDAARHLFRVAAGLDSLVTGEAEIQGQVRDAYHQALEPGTGEAFSGTVLNRVFQMALSVGGRVRSETTVSEGAASVASVAVELAQKIFGQLAGKRVLVLGAGEASELVVEALSRQGVEGVVVANRTYDRAADLATRLRGRAVELDQIQRVLAETDIVVSSTGAPHALITRKTLKEAFPSGLGRPLLFVDIAIPRDVAPEVGNESRVFLYNVDDLRHIVDQNIDRRRDALQAAEAIVDEEVESFRSWFAGLRVVPAIRALREQGDAMRASELERLLSRLDSISPEEREEILAFSRRLTNKLLHRPTVRIRKSAAAGRGEDVIEAFDLLFGAGPELAPSPDEADEEAVSEPHGADEDEREGRDRSDAAHRDDEIRT